MRHEPAAGNGHVPRIRVLVAEDDLGTREFLVELVRSRAGLELAAAAGDAHAAIAGAEAEQPDVAILDMRMPGGGGMHALHEIRRRSPATRVIVYSGDDNDATVRELLDAGAASYLLKGTSMTTILETIEEAAGRGA
jgi:DNA-binding NarL/FixJ family response regulator